MSTFPAEVRFLPVGIALALFPHPDPTLSMEIQRAPDSSGSPDTGSAETVGIVPPGSNSFVDIVGGTGLHHYRARHVRPKATPGEWTDWLALVPEPIPPSLPVRPGLGLIHNDTSPGRDTGGSTSPVTLQSVTIPALMLGRSRGIRITGTFQPTGTTATKSAWIGFNVNADVAVAWGAGDEDVVDFELVLVNRDDTAAQYITSRIFTDNGSIATKPAGLTRTIDTTADFTVDFRADVTDAADIVTLQLSRIELLGAA